MRFLAVCLGGAVGSGARYLVSLWALERLNPAFPYGTLLVNVVGSFLIGAVMQVGVTTDFLPPTVRILLVAGFLGGFTTFSSFSYETVDALQRGLWRVAAANVAVNVLGCLAACLAGILTARWLITD